MTGHEYERAREREREVLEAHSCGSKHLWLSFFHGTKKEDTWQNICAARSGPASESTIK